MMVRSSVLAGLIGIPRSAGWAMRLQHLITLAVLLVSAILIPMEVRAAQIIDCGGGEYPTKNTALVLRSTDSGTVIRNCVFRDWNAQIGAVIQIDNANDILIEDNRFENIRRSDYRDIHAVNIAQYGQRVTIRDNIFINVGADGVQMGDAAASSGGDIRDITITNNEFSSTNENIGEEGVDIKRVHANVLVAGNRFHGFRPCEANVQTGCTGSSGAGMVVHAGATGVRIERNRFSNNIYGLTVGAGYANIPPREIMVRNNFFYDNQRRALQIDIVHSIKLLNNTIVNSGYQHIYVNATPSSTDGWCFNRNNLFAGGTAPASVCTPQNNQYYSDPAAAGFVNLVGRDLHLQQTSPAVDAGQALTQDVPTDIDGQGRPYGNSYDVGADEFARNDQPGCLTATSTAWQYQALPSAQTGSFVVVGDLTPPALGTAGALAVAAGQPAAQNWDGLAAIVLFDDTDNRIKARNGGSYVDASPALSYQAGTRYHIRMVVNVQSHTYDAYVTPAGGSEIMLGTGLAFRTSQSTVASLDHIVVAAGSNGSSIAACNLWFSPAAPPASPVLVGAGDIALCDSTGTPVAATRATAALLDSIPGTVFTTGDNAYNSGTSTEFQQCYDPTWGRHKTRTRPTPGNHEYGTSGASGYFGYFGALAGDPAKGYYSYNQGQWHIIALNSNCSALGNGSTSAGCGATSAQATWLQQDLAANPARCTLAYWHHPRWSSGAHGSSTAMSTIWQMLYDANADVVLAGHDHNYERFAPLNGSGAVDTARGIRQFVVGTGGAALRSVGTLLPTSEKFDSSTHGVLKLTLHASSYDWRFVPVAGGSFTEQGSGTCH